MNSIIQNTRQVAYAYILDLKNQFKWTWKMLHFIDKYSYLIIIGAAYARSSQRKQTFPPHSPKNYSMP